MASKLGAPRLDGGEVKRSALIAKLNGSERPIIAFCAGAGYGKSTTLAQWAQASSDGPFAWVSLDRHDNDPVVLLTYIAAALDESEALDDGVFAALASPGTSVEGRLVPLICAALAGRTQPVVLVLDDVQEITNPSCVDALVDLAGHVPSGSHIVFATRDPGALPLGLWRARRLVLEVGTGDLRMDEDEARALLNVAATGFSPDDAAELIQRTEGWPTGLYLAALAAAATDSGASPQQKFTGNDPFVADFLRSELIAALPPSSCASSPRPAHWSSSPAHK